MARYTAKFVITGNGDRMYQTACDLLRESGFRALHESQDYVMGSEEPGTVKFSLLTTAEILIDINRDRTSATLTLLVKNEELPLSKINHCRTTFQSLQASILDCELWTATLQTTLA